MSIESILEKADKQLDYSSYKKAETLYRKALEMLPAPQVEQEQYLEIMAAIGDTLIWQNRLREATKFFTKTMNHPGAEENGYLHLRLGQLAYERKELEVATVELKRALELGGDELFADEYRDYYLLAGGTKEEL